MSTSPRTPGRGHVYHGRYKSFPIQHDEHFLTVARYVERNALRASLVKVAGRRSRIAGWWRLARTTGAFDPPRRRRESGLTDL